MGHYLQLFAELTRKFPCADELSNYYMSVDYRVKPRYCQGNMKLGPMGYLCVCVCMCVHVCMCVCAYLGVDLEASRRGK